MPSKQPTNLAASVRQRLYNLAKAGEEELQVVLTRYGVERLLYRLSRTAGGERFVLKGAVLFHIWEIDAPEDSILPAYRLPHT